MDTVFVRGRTIVLEVIPGLGETQSTYPTACVKALRHWGCFGNAVPQHVKAALVRADQPRAHCEDKPWACSGKSLCQGGRRQCSLQCSE